jgi:hypothetical protein
MFRIALVSLIAISLAACDKDSKEESAPKAVDKTSPVTKVEPDKKPTPVPAAKSERPQLWP